MVVCVDPVFNESVLKSYGYDTMSYFHGGSSSDDHFIGWNGVDGKHNSTHILSKILNGELWKSFYLFFKDKAANESQPRVQFRLLLYPHGMCLLIKPPEGQMSFKHMFMWYNSTKWLEDVHLNVFLMDPVNSPMIFPMDFQMLGDHIRAPLEKKYTSFVVRTSRSYHVEGDPAFDCREYNQELS